MPNQPDSESPRILSTGEFVDWHTKIGDEIDIEAKQLQIELSEDPSLKNDPEFQARVERLKGRQELLERAGEDFSSLSITRAVERGLDELLGPAEE